MKNINHSLALFALAAGLTLNSVAQAPAAPAAAPQDPGTIRSAIDLVRSDIKNDKAIILAENMDFTADESAEFWPLFNDYNAALNLLLDERLKLIKGYVDMHETMTNEQATVLAGKVFDLEAKRVDLKRTWFKKFSEVIPPTKAAKFFQIENQLNAVLDLIVMDAVPLIK